MKVIKLIFKNALRHKLRTSLTILGMAIAVIAFCLLRTVVTAWYVGVDAAAANRLITRQAASFINPLPISQLNKIRAVDGVATVTYAVWFSGVYIDKNQFFARMMVDPETFFDVYPEFKIDSTALKTFQSERSACIVGEDIAKTYNLKIGSQMVLDGDIFPGRWEFVVKGIYKKRDKNTDGTQMLMNYHLLNERMEVEAPPRANWVGWYIVKVKDPAKSASISTTIDDLFKNSDAETKTETERAFAQGFMSAFSAIITSMNVISFVIIGIILLVLGNTMIMAARERTREYAIFKTLGFSSLHLTGLILGESLFVSCMGGAVGLFLSVPMIKGVEEGIPKGMFPVFTLEPITIMLAICAILFVGLLSSIFPLQKALRMKIVDGFRFVG